MRRLIPAAVVVLGALALPPRALAADPKAECLKAADQGQSLRDDGKYLRAHDAFVTCSRDVCPKVVARSCAQWMREVDDATPTVVLGAKDDTGADLPQATVTIDGKPLTTTLDGKPVSVDPGEHALHFERDGSAPADARVVVRAGEKNRVIAVVLHAAGATGATPPADTGEPSHAPFQTARYVTSIAILVAGAAGIGIGAYFVAQAGSESGTANNIRSGLPNDACSSPTPPSSCSQLKNAVSSQQSDSTTGTVLLVAGGVLVAGAVVTWLVWPKPADAQGQEKTGIRWVAPSIVPGGATLGVSGSF
jgi:hypothetical protein